MSSFDGDLTAIERAGQDLGISISAYLRRTTPAKYKFIRKVMGAFIAAMYGSDVLSPIVQRVEDTLSPSDIWFLFRELDKNVRKYPGLKYFPVLSSSVQRKNLATVQMVANLWNLGDVEFRYGPAMYQEIVTTTDPVRPVSTDTNMTTDMQLSGFPVLVLMMDYAIKADRGMYTYDEVWSALLEASDFLRMVKPVRVTFVPLSRPNLIISRWNLSDVDGVNFTARSFQQLDALTDDELDVMYTKLSCTSSTEHYLTEVYHSPRKRVWTCFADSQMQDFVLQSGKLGYSDLRFTIDWSAYSDDDYYDNITRKYLCRICFNFSSDRSTDNFFELTPATGD